MALKIIKNTMMPAHRQQLNLYTYVLENTQHFNYHKLWYLFLYFGVFHLKYAILHGLFRLMYGPYHPIHDGIFCIPL